MQIEVNNKAVLKTAGKYVAEDITIIAKGGNLPQLFAPSISLSGNTLTITPNASNGGFSTDYSIYDGSTFVKTVTTTTVDLSTVFAESVTQHTVTVQATADNFQNSAASNSVTYANIKTYSITTAVTGFTPSASNPTSINTGEQKTLNFTLNDGYEFPDDTPTITGASLVSWTSSGALTIKNPTANVTITITATKLPDKLATPQIVTADGTTVSWDEVEHATSYDVYVDGAVYETITEQPTPSYVIEAGTYKFIDNLKAGSEETLSELVNFVYNVTYTTMLITNFNNASSLIVTYKGVTATGGAMTFVAYKNGAWTNEGVKTITFLSNQSVSPAFYKWAITDGNLVKQGSVSGEFWVINKQNITLPETSLTGNFISNDLNFNRIKHTDNILQYNNTNVYNTETGWYDEKLRTIYFKNAASGNMLTWLQANGVKQEEPTSDINTVVEFVSSANVGTDGYDLADEDSSEEFIDFLNKLKTDGVNTFSSSVASQLAGYNITDSTGIMLHGDVVGQDTLTFTLSPNAGETGYCVLSIMDGSEGTDGSYNHTDTLLNYTTNNTGSIITLTAAQRTQMFDAVMNALTFLSR